MSAKVIARPVAAPVASSVSQTRVVVAAVIGNLLEFFDFTVYSFFALTIAKLICRDSFF